MASPVWSTLPRSSTKQRRRQGGHRRPVFQHLHWVAGARSGKMIARLLELLGLVPEDR
jgi:hypothetical protein